MYTALAIPTRTPVSITGLQSQPAKMMLLGKKAGDIWKADSSVHGKILMGLYEKQ